MAQERSNVDNIDRVDPSRSTLETSGRTVDGHDAPAVKNNVLDLATTPDDDTPAEAGHIKGQIEETRKEMGETIDAIQDRLSFANISGQVTDHVNHAVETAKGAVYDATIGKAADMMKNLSSELGNTSIVKQAKENPLPFILIGAGAGLLAYQSFAGKGNGKSKRHEFTRAGDSRASLTGSAADKVGDLAHTAGDKLNEVTGSVTAAAGSAYDKVTGAVDQAYAGVGAAAGRAYEKVGELKSTAVNQYDHYMDENPLAVGAVALALGAAVGMAIPATQYEGQLMGDARQGLMEKAQTTASHLLDKTKEVVSEAGRTAADQAKALTTEH